MGEADVHQRISLAGTIAKIGAEEDAADRAAAGMVMGHRYLAFAGSRFYPAGGLGDCVGAFETWEEAHDVALEEANKHGLGRDEPVGWAHVYDTREKALKILTPNPRKPMSLRDSVEQVVEAVKRQPEHIRVVSRWNEAYRKSRTGGSE